MTKKIRAPLVLAAVVAIAVYLLFGGMKFYQVSAGKIPLNIRATSTIGHLAASTTPVVTHLPTPKPVKAIYMTACYAGSKLLRLGLINLAEQTEVNAIVINIKDETGKISIKTDNLLFKDAYATAGCPVPDMKELVAELHRKGIYAIARIAVFQDPNLVKKHPEWAVKRASDGVVWRDRKGISWLDVKATPVWDYAAELAEESYRIGFDEINFDYIRFPSDGDMSDIAYPYYQTGQESKAVALRDFFAGLKTRLRDLPVPISVDLFGMTCTNYDDLGIGQVLENALPYFDYVAPMVYPSHYPPGYDGYKNPAAMPYEIIKFNLDTAVRRMEAASTSPMKLRPWLQDFDLGADYTADMIRAEKQAVYDSGLDSWMTWDPTNRYTRGAYNVTAQ